MKDLKSLSHVRWDCKYHLVFIPKYRHRTIYGEVRKKDGHLLYNLFKIIAQAAFPRQYLRDRFLTKNGRDSIKMTMRSIESWFQAGEWVAVQ